MRFLLAFAILPALAAAQSRDTALLLTVRPACGIVETSYTDLPGSNEGLLRFRYLARAGAEGGKFYLNAGLGAGDVRIVTKFDGPVTTIGEEVIPGGANAAIAEIEPHGRTPKSGHAGQIRVLWPIPEMSSKAIKIDIVCH